MSTYLTFLVFLACNQLWSTVSRLSPRGTGRSYYDPCDYPRPSDPDEFSRACASTYLGSNIFCDPDHQFSRTEADSLRASLSPLNVSSCLCGLPSTALTGSFEACTEFRVAVLFAPLGSIVLKYAPSHPRVPSGRNEEVCDYLRAQSTPLHEVTANERTEQFAKRVLHIWREDSKCELDLLYVVFKESYPFTEERKVANLVAYVSAKLQRRLNAGKAQGASANADWSPLNVYSLGRHPSDVLVAFKSVTAMISSGPSDRLGWTPRPVNGRTAIDRETPYQSIDASVSMPGWAVILFIVCILSLPLCVIIGNVVSVVPSRRLTQAIPDQTSMRWAHKRWRAGFGGGFFGIRWKSPITTAGDLSAGSVQPRAKPQSNNMMFRQFTKFKKAKPQTSSANAEMRTSNWVYV